MKNIKYGICIGCRNGNIEILSFNYYYFYYYHYYFAIPMMDFHFISEDA